MMNLNIKGFITLIFLICMLVPHAYAAESKAYNGSIRSDGCLSPDRGYVKEVCFDYTINWKMWTLMGEPVENYNLRCKVKSFKLVKPSKRGEALLLSGDYYESRGSPTFKYTVN